MLFGRNPVVNSASLRARTEARHDKFRKSIPPQTSRPFGPSLAVGPQNGGKRHLRTSRRRQKKKRDICWRGAVVASLTEHQKSVASEGYPWRGVFFGGPFNEEYLPVRRASLYCPAKFTIDTGSREAPAIIRARWASGASTSRGDCWRKKKKRR